MKEFRLPMRERRWGVIVRDRVRAAEEVRFVGVQLLNDAGIFENSRNLPGPSVGDGKHNLAQCTYPRMIWDEIVDKHKSHKLEEGLANSLSGDDSGLCMGGGVGGGLKKTLGRKRRVVL